MRTLIGTDLQNLPSDIPVEAHPDELLECVVQLARNRRHEGYLISLPFAKGVQRLEQTVILLLLGHIILICR